MRRYLIFITSIAVCFTGCRDQDDIYRKYVTEGGIVYPAKADNAMAKPGLESVEISWPNTSAAVTSATIYWNDYADSVSVNIAPGTDTVRQIINIAEGIYSFYIRTYDKNGNVSVPVEIIGRSLGDTYLATLGNRAITGYKMTGSSSLTVIWDAPIENTLYTVLTYTATNGSKKSVNVENSETETVLADYKSGLGISVSSVYALDPQNPIPVSAPTTEATAAYVLIDKGIGRVADVSDVWPGDASTYAEHAYDGDYTKRYHSYTEPLPHWITIDLGAEFTVSRLLIWPSVVGTWDGQADRNMPSVITWEVSADNVTWTMVGKYDYDWDNPLNRDARQYYIEPVAAHYIRLTGLEYLAAPCMVLGELDFFTTVGTPNATLTPKKEQ
jgi:hypothetical protein